jgi:hypothetical protein
MNAPLFLATAALLATAAPAADAAPRATPGATAASQPRSGGYRIVKRGPHVIHARCLEGGHVIVPTHGQATPAERDRDIHDACKSVDYSK